MVEREEASISKFRVENVEMVRVMKVINHRGFLDQIIDTARSKLIERVDR